ncbi:DUF1906 domain-containing protein [Virgibacillus halophilus]|uniref:DUF1906 domain-containing protein n=1 Tax=Tigheibacillus halophilus TaxID=361280 RepID=A0ABU5C975_9BACI|nr:DUF1906 domain-containing protein [Virgibacillus halophilus]
MTVNTKKERQEKKNSNERKKNSKVYWGVDSASEVSKALYSCARENYGKPQVWGRYLGDKEVSKGITKNEASYLHDEGIKILLIYNHFQNATGYDNGKESAKQALKFANEIDAPNTVAIFADIEPNYKVDSAFIQGWYETLHQAKWNAGIYGDFSNKSKLSKALDGAEKNAKQHTILWSAQPQTKETSRKEAPDFKPDGMHDTKLYGWQYTIEAKNCEIDMNLFKQEMDESLW